jgi:hypothetical protein
MAKSQSGPTCPAGLTLAEFWSTFNPEESKEVILRCQSAPWDDILDEDDIPWKTTFPQMKTSYLNLRIFPRTMSRSQLTHLWAT